MAGAEARARAGAISEAAGAAGLAGAGAGADISSDDHNGDQSPSLHCSPNEGKSDVICSDDDVVQIFRLGWSMHERFETFEEALVALDLDGDKKVSCKEIMTVLEV